MRCGGITVARMSEILTTGEMAEADRLTIAGGVAGITLMENAGRAVADTVAARHPPGSQRRWGCGMETRYPRVGLLVPSAIAITGPIS